MISINRHLVNTLSKQPNSKQRPGKLDISLYPFFSYCQTNANDSLKEFSCYEMAHWINYTDRWLSSRISAQNTKGYKRGTIVFVDLGAGNFGHEPSFSHPAVVLAQTKDSILIAPCSSKKYGSGYPEIVDAEPSDGFSSKTGIQTKSIRWISKNRVISVAGTTTTDILNKIDTLLLQTIPLHARMILEQENIIKSLTAENNKLIADSDLLKKELAEMMPECSSEPTNISNNTVS